MSFARLPLVSTDDLPMLTLSTDVASNRRVQPSGPTLVRTLPCGPSSITSTLPQRFKKIPAIMHEPISTNGVKNKHKNSAIPSGRPLPSSISGAGNHSGNGPTKFDHKPAIAITTKTDTIPFQNSEMNNAPIAPEIDRNVACTRIRDPSSQTKQPEGVSCTCS
ncbi:MAG TPA: hypothetical protein DCM28_16170 [Phycisphaerales bacterium]|nr:hypothetical protein [Phycisphaerales bacterium]